MTKRDDATGGRTRRPRVIGNPVARSPLLRKGGVHERSASGKRQRAKLSTYDALEEWLETRDDESSDEMEKGSFGSPFSVCSLRCRAKTISQVHFLQTGIAGNCTAKLCSSQRRSGIFWRRNVASTLVQRFTGSIARLTANSTAFAQLRGVQYPQSAPVAVPSR
jgi:hypothetical protein